MFEDFYSVRLGPLYGPLHVAREVAMRCAPQVMINADDVTSVVVLPSATQEEIHLALYQLPAPLDGSDRGWR